MNRLGSYPEDSYCRINKISRVRGAYTESLKRIEEIFYL